MSGRVAAVESLYEGVVTEPARWNDQMFVDWADSVDADGSMAREEAKHIRRAMRAAQKLHAFWLEAPERPDVGWESKVDLAMGPKAWGPVLELAEIQLVTTMSEESFVIVARLVPLVNGESFLDGADFDEWKQTQSL